MGPLLRFQNVSKAYGRAVPVLQNIDLEVGKGVFGLLGPNGAGKTTLLRLAAGLLRPTTGSVDFDGCDAQRQKKLFRRDLGYLPQQFGLYPTMTAREHLLYFASLKGIGGKDARMQVDRLLFDMGLSDAFDSVVGTFSGGMKQRVGIAAALLGSPRLIIVDEPTAGLDPEERIRFRGILETVARDATVVLSTHILQDVELGCSRLAVVSKGRILKDSAPSEFVSSALGRVWAAEVSPELLDDLKRIRSVTSMRDISSNLIAVRFVGEAVGAGERAVEPQLEDAYVNLLTQDRQGDWL